MVYLSRERGQIAGKASLDEQLEEGITWVEGEGGKGEDEMGEILGLEALSELLVLEAPREDEAPPKVHRRRRRRDRSGAAASFSLPSSSLSSSISSSSSSFSLSFSVSLPIVLGVEKRRRRNIMKGTQRKEKAA